MIFIMVVMLCICIVVVLFSIVVVMVVVVLKVWFLGMVLLVSWLMNVLCEMFIMSGVFMLCCRLGNFCSSVMLCLRCLLKLMSGLV